MNKFLAVCFLVLSAGFASEASAQEKLALRLVQTIPLPGVKGRLDHMGVDLEKNRLFVAAVANNSLEVVDLTDGKVIKSLAGFKDTQDALFLGGDFNNLYVSSLYGHLRVFHAGSFCLVQDFNTSPHPSGTAYSLAQGFRRRWPFTTACRARKFTISRGRKPWMVCITTQSSSESM